MKNDETIEKKLASFAEWNPHPIVELNSAGEIIYTNLVARVQFPDLLEQGISHPMLVGLKNILLDFLPNTSNDITVFNREVFFHNKTYEQQVFGLPNEGIYIYIMDNTERNQLRAQSLLNDKLTTIGTLTAGIVHEINNPISWVLGNLSYIKSHVEILKSHINMISRLVQEHDVNKKLSYLDAVVNATKEQETIQQFDEMVNESLLGVEQICNIVHSVKRFAHSDETKNTPINVNEVLTLALKMVTPEYKYRANIEIDFDTNLPMFFVNGGELHQVFINLIVNAAQAIPEGDTNKNHIRVATKKEHDKIVVKISDTGKGIAPDILPKIFEPFFTTKPLGVGSGLGLSITKDIIKNLGGEVSVESVVDQGTTFTVSLPIQFEKLTAQPTTDEDSITPVKNKRILIVDDEPTLLKTLQRMLQDQHTVTKSLGGKAALALLTGHTIPYDVIITDLGMSEVSGMDLYRHVAKQFPSAEKYFIFISGDMASVEMKEFLEKSQHVLLEKPFMPKKLLHTIDKLFNEK